MSVLTSRAVLRKLPIGPRKLRKYADTIRLQPVLRALNILRFQHSPNVRPLEKLLLSAIANWEQRHQGYNVEDAQLIVQEVRIDGGSVLKRLRPAPHGRGHQILKRSCHATLVLASTQQLDVPQAIEPTQQTDEASVATTKAPAKVKTASKGSEKN